LMGINLDRFPRLPERCVPGSASPRIVSVCELTFRKGVDVLIDAMPAVWERMPDAQLHIMGHGDAADELRFLASTLDPAMERISFYGSVANPYASLGDFDLFAFPSRSDNLPISLLEAMLARLPVVASEVGGVPEIVGASGCGSVVPPESASALAEAIIGTLKLERDRLDSMGEKGERFVREQLDVRKTAVELDRIYHETLRKKGLWSRVA
jgi:L-malate glycosyltransferase